MEKQFTLEEIQGIIQEQNRQASKEFFGMVEAGQGDSVEAQQLVGEKVGYRLLNRIFVREAAKTEV